MSKIVERNVAEILVLIVFLMVILSGCGSVHNACAAYASVELRNVTAGGSDTEGQDEDKVFDTNGYEVN